MIQCQCNPIIYHRYRVFPPDPSPLNTTPKKGEGKEREVKSGLGTEVLREEGGGG